MQGAYKNDMIGLVFDGLSPGDPKMTGEDVIRKMYRLPLDHSKWWDLLAIFAILVAYRILFFIVLKLKESASPFFQSMYTKRTLDRLNKRASFKRFSSSRRNHNLRSLSSQEGLSSPLPQLQKIYFIIIILYDLFCFVLFLKFSNKKSLIVCLICLLT